MAAYYADISQYAQACHKEILSRKNGANGKIYVNRIISIQMCFLLHVKLDSIPEAADLLNELDNVHKIAGDVENHCLEDILARIDGLINFTKSFIETYKKI